MIFEIIHNKDERKFYGIINGVEAHLIYDEPEENILNYYHTYVPNELRGKGIAGKLVAFALKYAKANNKKIIPSCSFVYAFLQRNKEYSGLIK
jgi:predicted GNAT family acetyltransferase